jgi:LacI family transcriptional regulator
MLILLLDLFLPAQRPRRALMASDNPRCNSLPGAVRTGYAWAMRATISDVSRAAGVSVKTVSRVLNNERYVRSETRTRVEKAISELRFRPSLAARSLAGRRSFQVALICDNPSPYYVHAVQAGVRERCAVEHVRMIAQPYDMGADNLVEEIESLLDQTSPDGLILTPPATDFAPLLAMLRAREVPFVRISPGSDLAASPSVFIDNRAAAREMTERLLALGHRRIGFIAGHPNYAASGQRLTGYIEALQHAGLAVDLTLVRQGRFDFASGSLGTEELMGLADPPTAIFASSDDMAAGVLATAHRLGIAVPGRLSVAGFDDTDLARACGRRSATVRQPVRELAYHAADMLFRGEDPAERRALAMRS